MGTRKDFAGIMSDKDGIAVMHALRNIPNSKVVNRPTAKDPFTTLVPLAGASYELGDLARLISAVKTPSRASVAPSASLVISYKRQGDAAAIEQTLARTLERTCARVTGVDAAKSKIDTRRKEIYVKLNDKGGAKLAEIKAAFPGLNVE